MAENSYLMSWGMLLTSIVMNSLGAFAIKFKMNQLGSLGVDSFSGALHYLVKLFSSPAGFIGGLLFVAAPFVFAVALSRMEASVVFPIQAGLTFVILVGLAVIFLGESLTAGKVIGLVLILAGVFFVSR
jgi:multidrug transporter EmrE-like cation transporter